MRGGPPLIGAASLAIGPTGPADADLLEKVGELSAGSDGAEWRHDVREEAILDVLESGLGLDAAKKVWRASARDSEPTLPDDPMKRT